MLYDPMEEKLPLKEMWRGFLFAMALIALVCVGMLLWINPNNLTLWFVPAGASGRSTRMDGLRSRGLMQKRCITFLTQVATRSKQCFVTGVQLLGSFIRERQNMEKNQFDLLITNGWLMCALFQKTWPEKLCVIGIACLWIFWPIWEHLNH